MTSKADHAAICNRYAAGETLQQIGDSYGVTREWIRQILVRYGITGAGGGARRRSVARRAAIRERLNQTCLRRWGLPRTEYKALRAAYGYLPFDTYTRQRTNAKSRGIAWAFNFADWWALWQASGKWSMRGRGDGKYVMARLNDEGPYSPNNVEIKTCNDNGREYQLSTRPRRAAMRMAA